MKVGRWRRRVEGWQRAKKTEQDGEHMVTASGMCLLFTRCITVPGSINDTPGSEVVGTGVGGRQCVLASKLEPDEAHP